MSALQTTRQRARPEQTAPVRQAPSRARDPDVQGAVERDGVRLAYEVFGQDHSITVLLMPTWSIVPSRHWKAQVGYLSRYYRVVTFDGRGSGGSGRPTGAAAYTGEEYAKDTVAVLDATGTDRAVLVATSLGSAWALHVAAGYPDRVVGIFAIAPACWSLFPEAQRPRIPWRRRLVAPEGWEKYNAHYWLEGGYSDFVDFFFRELFGEPHSTRQIEEGIGWAHEITPQTLVDATAGALGEDGAVSAPLAPLAARVRCPVTVVHGTYDRIVVQACGEALAEATGGSLVLLEGCGHGPQARDPVRVNHLIREFVDRICPSVERTSWARAARRRKRALYLSSPIGLGHAQRDASIAAELRVLHPDLEIDWLAQHPVTRVLEGRGERIHPASGWLANESGHIEHESGEHDLHAFQAVRRMDEILVNNFMVFADVVAGGDYDLVVGDEAWDVDHFLHENPELKRFAFAWLTDFVGWLPMPEGGAAEAALTADHNAEMIEQRSRFRRIRDRSVFVGSPDDILDADFGPGLPPIRQWTEQNFDFCGYVTGFDPAALTGTEQLRRELGVGPDEKLCLITVGGSGVGGPLLHRVLDAVPLVRRLVPELRFLFVSGPRIDPASLPATPGATVVGYLPDLYRSLAACDLAVVQGGLTTCMELTALRKPFLYVPLRRHFEQQFHVRTRLDRYGAGRCLDYASAVDPDGLAGAIAEELTHEVAYRPVETDGAARAAEMLAELL